MRRTIKAPDRGSAPAMTPSLNANPAVAARTSRRARPLPERSLLLSLSLILALTVPAQGVELDESQRAQLDRYRMIGAAHYENDDFKPAAEAFKHCLAIDPGSAIDHFNLGLVEMRAQRHEQALEALDTAERLDPSLIAAVYVRGIVYQRLGRYEEATHSLRRVIEADPQCFGAFYNLGVSLKFLEQFEQSREAFSTAVEIDPLHPSGHYQMIVLSRRLGDVELAARHAEIFDRIKDTLDESEKTVEALERSRYSYIIEAPRLGEGLSPRPDAPVRFVNITEASGLTGDRHQDRPASSDSRPLPSILDPADHDLEELRTRHHRDQAGSLTLHDVDQDGLLDLYVTSCDGPNQLYLNQGAKGFVEMAGAYGATGRGCGLDAVFGDLDNDSHDDLYLVNAGPNVLLKRQGNGVLVGSGAGEPGLALILATPQGTELPEDLRVDLELTVPAGTTGSADEPVASNGFLVLDYQGPSSFKYLGARIDEATWVIGHFDGAWNDDVRLESGIATDEAHSLHIVIDSGRVELLPGFAGADATLSHDFGAPLLGAVGLASDRSSAHFDRLRIRQLKGARQEILLEDLGDGSADGFEVVSGAWQVRGWGFEDVSEQARADEPQLGHAAVLTDYDHDNDLDIFVVNGVDLDAMPASGEIRFPDDLPGQVNTMLRNNGNAVFTDETDQCGLLVDLAPSLGVISADLDADHDLDLLVSNQGAESRLFLNQRLGRLAPGGRFSPPLGTDVRDIVTADLDRDSRLDLVVATGNELRLYLGRPKLGDATGDQAGDVGFLGRTIELPSSLAEQGVSRIKLIDVSNDGWPDLLLVSADRRSLAALVASGPELFVDRTAELGLGLELGSIADVAVGDLDGDGDEDVVVLDRIGALTLLDNRSSSPAHHIEVQLTGRKVNRNGIGATVEIASGGHYLKRVVEDTRPLHFGLGEMDEVSVVRVTWPNGVAQNVVEPQVGQRVVIEEHVRVSASCGFLWAYDGAGFQLINEILGIGPLGAPIAPGVYHQPDSTELTTIHAEQLEPVGGLYELRLSEELRELMYADAISLRAIDHPDELEIVANEMFTAPPFPEDTFFALADVRTPVAAFDSSGKDVLELIRHHDDRYPEPRRTSRYDGLAELHHLTIDLGDLSDLKLDPVEPGQPGARRLMLFLDGWIYWPDASTVMAMDQDPNHGLIPPSLEALGSDGTWRAVLPAVGLPTSKGLIVPVDLSGIELETSKLRIVTNMSLYWDRIFFATLDQAARCRVTHLPVHDADLRYRGFSRLDRDDLGFERFDYTDVSPTGPWSPPPGMLTRYGPVEDLLHDADDRYVIFGPGDELALRFDATRLPELAPGWSRVFIFYANGWVKDGDLNTALSHTVEPLPFHGMSGYPYGPDEHYPETEAHRAYREQYNTRPGVPTVGRLTGGR